jgi:CxxC-x17-CxxC domain-containing protein
VRAAVFGNVGTIICFRLGAEDAEVLAKEFAPQFDETDLINLDKYEIYVKLMIDGITSDPFSAVTLPPLSRKEGNREKIIRLSRERYAESRRVVEEKIARWSGVVSAEAASVPQVAKFEAKCDICGTTVFVPFIPDGVRPVFCKKCLKKQRKAQAVKSNQLDNPQQHNQPSDQSTATH